MKKTGQYIIPCTFAFFLFMSAPSLSFAVDDAYTGLTKTALIHGKVSLGGFKEMIYYLEKVSGMGTPDEKSSEHTKEALKNAKAAYELFQKAISHAEASIGMGSSEEKKK